MKRMSLDEVKLVSLDILKYVDKFCKENSIKYWLCAGTLLGAVRHKGFIPWDDDIDIMMMRPDYERFITEFPKHEFYDVVHFAKNKDFPCAYAKVIDTRTKKVELPIRNQNNVIGVDIDVFPIDNIPNNFDCSLKMYSTVCRKSYILQFLISKYGIGSNVIKKAAYCIILTVCRIFQLVGLISVKKIISNINDIAQSYNQTSTDYCGITCIHHYGIKERNNKKTYNDSVNVLFEGNAFPAPIEYDSYLRNLYGDYMSLPPKEKQVTHHKFEAFWMDSK